MIITDKLFDAFLKCQTKAHLLSCAAAGAGRASHPISDWQQRLASEFKQECSEMLTAVDPRACFMGTLATHDLTHGHHPLIIGPIVIFEDTEAHIHALELVEPSKKTRHNRYMPIRFTPSEKITKHHRLQLAFDAFVLAKASGRVPISGKIIHGRRKRAFSIKLNGLIGEVESLVAKMRLVLASDTPPDLILIGHCSECEFEARCRSNAVQNDNLSLLGGISSTEIQKLRSRGIFTVTQLSYTFRPRKKTKRSLNKQTRYHHALKALAIREKKIFVTGAWQQNEEQTPVYLDVEGIPDRKFYYLIGMRFLLGTSLVQRSFWANDADGEETIWREFLQAIEEIHNPQLIYYGSYETVFLKNMKSRYGDAGQKKISVDRLMENGCNILSIIYGNIYFPTYSNGLKDIATLLGFKWSTPMPSGQRSLLLRHVWEVSGDVHAKQELVAYNADDCEALESVVKIIQQVIPAGGGTPAAVRYPGATDIDTLKPSWPYTLGRVEFALPELALINRCAYWDYQRDRIYIRSNPRLRRAAKRTHRKKRRNLPVNVTVGPSRPWKCPACDSRRILLNGRHSRLIYDLRFSVGGVKRWVGKYVTVHYKCRDCSISFHSDEYQWTKHRYGPNILAYVIYNIVELHIPQSKLAKIIHRTFGYPLGQPTINRLKRRAVELYRDTYEEITASLLRGKLMHADETHVSVKGKASYVWVFTSMEEVIYIWSETRDGSVAGELLKSFKGVLVSDFYSAYDSIDCPQQKCLIHLIRDLNNHVLQEPFNEEIKRIVHDFTKLLKPVIATIDRFGLRARFLKKYKIDVTRFFVGLLQQKYKTELAQKVQERFRRNRERLFTFIDYDNVPWNNNNAEHAIKAFAGLREVVEGPSTESGIRDYLMLLSICRTCEYRSIDFFEFLRSGEKGISAFIGKRNG
jgi:predicted RecB family nuclease